MALSRFPARRKQSIPERRVFLAELRIEAARRLVDVDDCCIMLTMVMVATIKVLMTMVLLLLLLMVMMTGGGKEHVVVVFDAPGGGDDDCGRCDHHDGQSPASSSVSSR